MRLRDVHTWLYEMGDRVAIQTETTPRDLRWFLGLWQKGRTR